MNILRQIDIGTLISVVGCALACLTFGGILGTILHVLGMGLGIITMIINTGLHIVTGGPVVWCGCLVLMMACGGCLLFTVILTTTLPQCGTANAVNLCRFFGY